MPDPRVFLSSATDALRLLHMWQEKWFFKLIWRAVFQRSPESGPAPCHQYQSLRIDREVRQLWWLTDRFDRALHLDVAVSLFEHPFSRRPIETALRFSRLRHRSVQFRHHRLLLLASDQLLFVSQPLLVFVFVQHLNNKCNGQCRWRCFRWDGKDFGKIVNQFQVSQSLEIKIELTLWIRIYYFNELHLLRKVRQFSWMRSQ